MNSGASSIARASVPVGSGEGSTAQTQGLGGAGRGTTRTLH